MDARPDTARLFLALWPDPAVREALRAWRDAWTWPRGASPVHTDKLHVTLHFLGDLPTARLAALADGFAVPFSPFALRFERGALWHNGIAVLEPSEEPPGLLDLHARLSQALVGLGLQPEARTYRPHVTMARRAKGAEVPAGGPAVHWQVDRYVLVESRGGSYTVLRDYLIPSV
ncbi:RNA 2',3'-cyclic phosphodiesterase [Herbaspirillum sp. SJZ107]|uniref:RNA 2',3'-cyclic phosphodiesterase n=1 Tax=Herbaspirillum sp. SJZ107 TaxID=2572881 RepID=UPI001151F857|nr:RNA 2',3'-cyclic phosphodiesterase [Herbaspirillum sp. SJZ107]TQK06880.1 2'-5' RNA ligase [Herbaspirillum sp. SJZ107]